VTLVLLSDTQKQQSLNVLISFPTSGSQGSWVCYCNCALVVNNYIVDPLGMEYCWVLGTSRTRAEDTAFLCEEDSAKFRLLPSIKDFAQKILHSWCSLPDGCIQ
jgi:hypothetical protein